jgi:short subunit dehydrogenase-like uncharacterized protein
MARRAPVVVVIGATGYTGRLVAEELRRHGAPFVVAGRDPTRLKALAESLGGLATARTVDVTDPDSLAATIHTGEAVIDCVGPFTQLGEPVVRACLDAGAHYLDIAGEQAFIQQVHRRYHDAARDAGVSVVLGTAFEYALADCAAALGGAGMTTPLRSLDVIYAWRGAVSSRGTRRTAVRMVGRRGVVIERGEVRRYPQGARTRTAMISSSDPVSAVLFTSGEVITVPRHLEVETLRGWMVTTPRTAQAARVVAPVLPIVVRLFRPLIEAVVTRRPDPTPEERAASRFTIRLELQSRTGIRRALELRGRDPYHLTAVIAVAGAHRVLEPDAPRGVLAPAQLFEPRQLLSGLAGLGLRLVENA